MFYIIIGVIIGYLVGSIPTAYVFARLLKGIDIRKFGSGNVGATNALRVLGKGPGILVLLLDILKGLVVVVFLSDLIYPKVSLPNETLRMILGLSCILGHNWTIFLKFKGGKGVATTLGVLLGLAIKIVGLRPVWGLIILTWLIVFIIARIVSLASLITAVALPIYMVLFRQSSVLIFSSIILAIFIVLRHRANLKKLLQGKEKRLF